MGAPIHPKSIVILDFGGQYAHLIARRVREAGAFSEIRPPDTSADDLKEKSYGERFAQAIALGSQSRESLPGILADIFADVVKDSLGSQAKELGAANKGGVAKTPLSIVPKMAPTVSATGSTQTVNVNQNLNFQHDGKDSQRTGDSVKKAVQDAYRQSAAQAQVN